MSRKSAELSAQLNSLTNQRGVAAVELERTERDLAVAYQGFVGGNLSIDQAIGGHARVAALQHLVSTLGEQIETAKIRVRRLKGG